MTEEEINNFATALRSTFPILNEYALCLQRPMEISGKNARERNEVVQSRVAVIPSTGVTVPLGDIDVENKDLIFRPVQRLGVSRDRGVGEARGESPRREEETKTTHKQRDCLPPGTSFKNARAVWKV